MIALYVEEHCLVLKQKLRKAANDVAYESIKTFSNLQKQCADCLDVTAATKLVDHYDDVTRFMNKMNEAFLEICPDGYDGQDLLSAFSEQLNQKTPEKIIEVCSRANIYKKVNQMTRSRMVTTNTFKKAIELKARGKSKQSALVYFIANNFDPLLPTQLGQIIDFAYKEENDECESSISNG